MNQKDQEALAAIQQAIERDQQVREDIRRTLECHDRAFFAQVVDRVINRLHLAVPDVRGFTDMAYEWFKDKL